MKDTAPTPAEQVRALTVKIGSLEAHAAEYHREHLALDAAGASPIPPTGQSSPAALRHKWLNGFGGEPPATSADERLYEVIENRSGIAAAIDELQRRLFQAKADEAREWWSRNEKHWGAIQLRRVRALLQLQAANASADRFRREAAAVFPGVAPLPADRISGIFAPTGIGGDQVTTFLEAAVKAGLVSREEVQS